MRNEITGIFGAASFANGLGVADVDFNQFNTNLMALTVIDQNPDFNFFENCFNSSYSDVFVNGTVSGIIYPDSLDQQIIVLLMALPLQVFHQLLVLLILFYYIEPSGTDVDCRMLFWHIQT
ncbi:MAG: hypothetical protein IPI30_10725 [Saprospiraceae bacterium]|nr:hypothetical protein [Candidatus Vicinibacter affinis]